MVRHSSLTKRLNIRRKKPDKTRIQGEKGGRKKRKKAGEKAEEELKRREKKQEKKRGKLLLYLLIPVNSFTNYIFLKILISDKK